MTIDGNGDTIDATALAFTAIWNMGFDFTVEHLTVRHGIGDRIRAGAIQNDPGGNVTITDCNSTQNLGGAGGALINLPCATMAVNNSSFTDNDAYDAGGGAIANFGTMTVSGSAFSSNTAIYDPLVPPLPRARSAASAAPAEQAPGDGTGGAIGNFGGDLTLSGVKSTFTDNQAGAGGGAIGNFGSALGQPVDDGIRADAPAAPVGSISVTNAVFTGNQASGNGGAIANTGSASTVANSGFTGNSAAGNVDAGVAAATSGVPAADAPGGNGGAIATTTSLSLPGDNFTRNRATGNGGGIFVSGGGTTLTSNTIVTSNTAGGTGGGIDRTGGTVSLTHGVLVLLNRPNNCTGLAC